MFSCPLTSFVLKYSDMKSGSLFTVAVVVQQGKMSFHLAPYPQMVKSTH